MSGLKNEGRTGLRSNVCIFPEPNLNPDSSVDSSVQRHIGKQLRVMYAGILEQHLPGRLLVLLSQLERQNREMTR